MKFKPASPVIQRLLSSLMSWMMDNQDGKVRAGQVLEEINKVTPIIKGVEGCTDDVPLVLPEELSWARGDPAISTAVFFLSSEAELMAKTFVPKVKRSALGKHDKGGLAMLRLMLVTVVASYTVNDDLLSECQEYHGFRGTHAAVHWAAFLAARRMCQLAVAVWNTP
eukprot:jgi/Undpi1/10185/HiC_scaffold_28.g12638.m1